MWLWGLQGVCSTCSLAGGEEEGIPTPWSWCGPAVLLCLHFLLYLHSKVDEAEELWYIHLSLWGLSLPLARGCSPLPGWTLCCDLARAGIWG